MTANSLCGSFIQGRFYRINPNRVHTNWIRVLRTTSKLSLFAILDVALDNRAFDEEEWRQFAQMCTSGAELATLKGNMSCVREEAVGDHGNMLPPSVPLFLSCADELFKSTSTPIHLPIKML